MHSESQRTHGKFRLATGATDVVLAGEGQGLIEALIDAVNRRFGVSVDIIEFDEHAMSAGTEAKALASVTVEIGGKQASACCIDEDTSRRAAAVVEGPVRNRDRPRNRGPDSPAGDLTP